MSYEFLQTVLSGLYTDCLETIIWWPCILLWWSLLYDDPVCCSPRLRLVSQLVRECVHEEAAVRPSALRVKKTIAARLLQSSSSSASSSSSSSADSLKKGPRVHPAPLVPGHPVKMVWRINKYCLKVFWWRWNTKHISVWWRRKILLRQWLTSSLWPRIEPSLSPRLRGAASAPLKCEVNTWQIMDHHLSLSLRVTVLGTSVSTLATYCEYNACCYIIHSSYNAMQNMQSFDTFTVPSSIWDIECFLLKVSFNNSILRYQ